MKTHKIVLILILIALPLQSCGTGAIQPAQGVQVSTLPDHTAPLLASDLAKLSSELPEDTTEAAVALVNIIYGESPELAKVATGELLRRAGIPLVATDGPVVAMPDDLVLVDAFAYVDLVNELTRATRGGDFYTPEQLGFLLEDIGVFTEEMPLDALIGGLGQWGKSPSDPPESQFASAAVRALSAHRGQVLYAGADMSTLEIDPLQTYLIIAHATSRALPRNEQATSLSLVDQLFGVSIAHAQGTQGDCDALANAVKTEDQVEETIVKATKDNITDSWKGMLSEGAQSKINLASQTYDKGTAALNVLLLLMGARIDVTTTRPATHFRHTAGDRSNNVLVKAIASFDSALAQKKLSCYALAGIEVPPNGKLNGFRVRWSISQPTTGSLWSVVGAAVTGSGEINYQGQYLMPMPSDNNKLSRGGGGGEVSGADGQSTLELYSPREKAPGEGKIREGKARVIASLDKDEFPFKLSDLLGLKDVAGKPGAVYGMAFDKIYELALAAIKRAGLPSQQIAISVKHHGSDIYIAKGEREIFAIWTFLGMGADLYTCDGLDGQWKGQAGISSTRKSPLESAQITVAGWLGLNYEGVPEGEQVMPDVRFIIHPAGENLIDLSPELKLSGIVSITRLPVEDEHLDGQVGQIEILFGGFSFSASELGGASFIIPVIGVTEDPRCPGGGYDYSPPG